MSFLKYGVKELFNNKRFCILFILNLSLGLAGFIALDAFKESLDLTIRGRSKAVLGADFGFTARRPLLDSEIETVEKHLGSNFKSSTMVEMFSMVANQKRGSRLVQVKAIDENYPFYGILELESFGPVDERAHKILKSQPVVWIYPELLRQLEVKVGDRLFIGEQEFEIQDVVIEDAAAGISTSMAPRVYVNREFLGSTGLIKKGSIAWHSKVYYLPNFSNEDLDKTRDQVFEKLDSPDIRVFTHENVSEQMTALLTRLNDFLGLASLVALFLAGVGSSFLFRSYFRKRIQQVAILVSLGSSRLSAFSYYLFQVMILGLVSAAFASLIGVLIVPGIGELTRSLLPFEIVYGFSYSTFLLGLLLATLGSFFICLPVLIGLKNLKPSLLLINEQRNSTAVDWKVVVSFAPGLALFLAMAVSLSNSYQVGGLFTLLFLGSALALGFSGVAFFSILQKSLSTKNLSLKWALRDISRNRLTTLTGFVAIGLGALLLNLIPQVQKSLQTELERPDQSRLPSLFMFDIQEDQLPAFQDVLKSQSVELDQISPMIRARLLKVNGEEFDKGEGSGQNLTREQEREMRFRNRGFNLSYRSQLTESESLVAGQPFSGEFVEGKDQLPEISVEKRFADRLNLKLGDVLEFDVESIPIVGRIVNLRKVQWTSFRPNFFVQFQPGVLELAPKTFIATVPSLNLNRKHQLQDALVEKLPNVSMVDVSRIVKRLSGIMEQMSWALLFMSLLSLLAGFVVIFSIANHQASSRAWEVGLLKSLGANFSDIRNQFLWQYSMISFFAFSFGALLSLFISFLISKVLFDGLWIFDWKVPLVSVVLGTVITLWVTQRAVKSSLSESILKLFSIR